MTSKIDIIIYILQLKTFTYYIYYKSQNKLLITALC
jgi:hypothetical protein